MKYRSITKLIGGLAAAAVLSACGGGGNGDNTGTLSLRLTDAPVDEITKLEISFMGVTAKPQEGEQISWTFDSPRTIDLVALQGGLTADLINNERVPAGPYNWIAVDVNPDETAHSATLKSNGQVIPVTLRVPSNRIRFVSGFTVTVNRLTDFLIDWDLRRAVSISVGKERANVRPAFRVTDMAEYAAIGGTVSRALMEDDRGDTGTCPDLTPDFEGSLVYLYPKMDHTTGTFDDIFIDDTTEEGPIATAQVKWNADMTGYEYQIHYVSPGDYTLAFTCQGSADFPESQDTIEFRAFVDVDGLTDGQDQLNANFE